VASSAPAAKAGPYSSGSKQLTISTGFAEPASGRDSSFKAQTNAIVSLDKSSRDSEAYMDVRSQLIVHPSIAEKMWFRFLQRATMRSSVEEIS
jgi:hypothetical protein